MEYSKSKKKKQKLENQKLMMKISSAKNVSGIGCVILLGGALITAAAMGSAFLVSRKLKKSTNKNITKKKGNEKIENESSNKGFHFLLPQQQQPSSNETDKLCDSDSTILLSTPCLIQDGKPKLDEKRDILNAIVSDYPKEEGKSPSFEGLQEELELSETKISLLPDPDQELDEVSRVRIEVIQGNEKIEVLSHVDQAQTTIFSNTALQMDNKREFLVHNDKGESNELQHTGVIETDNLEEGLIQEQEKQAKGDQETSTSNEHEPLNSAFELMKAADEDEDKDHFQCMYIEEQCADAETQIDQIAKLFDERMQLSDEEECAKQNDQVKSCYVEATSEYIPCRTYSIDVQNLDASVDDQHSAEVMDPAANGEQSLETEQLVEKQSFESDCQGNVLKENEVEDIVFVNEEEEEDDDYDDNIDKEDAAQEVEDDILEEARNSSMQSNSDKLWPADSNQELLLEHKEEIVKEVEEGTKIEEDELCSVENCNLKSTQNDVTITSCQQSYDGKDDSTVNVIDSYRTKLMYLDDIAAITRGRRVLLGVLLALIWYFVLKGILPSGIGGFKS
ncbi:uncharacterized protein LOC129882967 [Solanum dulcamara]|uniref:uncharacterized protein LOC129882967 n=1 Tax=Solanum dulcamara TaxID=45834 RepID=UPI0024866D5D|nr:uncharacterized protein LOC129882967 [Solanum dulcamara]